ncbi:hypothetical protein HMPREF1141_3455 [Clostridium sp. MSTE9]|nr:hypothetical protein HMPREF1141_3455 [Clostridium sp. MSTE9]
MFSKFAETNICCRSAIQIAWRLAANFLSNRESRDIAFVGNPSCARGGFAQVCGFQLAAAGLQKRSRSTEKLRDLFGFCSGVPPGAGWCAVFILLEKAC